MPEATQDERCQSGLYVVRRDVPRHRIVLVVWGRRRSGRATALFWGKPNYFALERELAIELYHAGIVAQSATRAFGIAA